MARTTEEIQIELAAKKGELDGLLSIPSYFAVHGQVIDNRQRIADLKRRIGELEAELAGLNPMQGPDLIV